MTNWPHGNANRQRQSVPLKYVNASGSICPFISISYKDYINYYQNYTLNDVLGGGGGDYCDIHYYNSMYRYFLYIIAHIYFYFVRMEDVGIK